MAERTSNYALVDFFERNEVDVIETKYIVTACDREDLNAESWNVAEKIQVLYPLNPSKGTKQKAFVARILRFGDSAKELAPFMVAAEEGLDVPMSGSVEYGRGKRNPRPKRAWPSGSELSLESEDESLAEQQQKLNKKRKTGHQSVNLNAPTELQKQLFLQEQNAHGSGDSTDLQEEVIKLRQENRVLRDSLRIIKGLPDLLKTMSTMLTQAGPVPSGPPNSEVTASSSLRKVTAEMAPGQLTLASPTIITMSELSPAHQQVQSPLPSPTHSHLRHVFGYDVNEDGQVDLGHGVLVNAHNLQYVTTKDARKTTYMISEVVFTKEELINSNLTGKKSNAFKEVTIKPKLDEKKVSAVIDFVMKIHPQTEISEIKKLIGVKLNIAQKVAKRRMAIEPMLS